tara:strand:+ start:16810 stop:17916 length:1107 start_codon:yes stop_codon:yes gene_type:complete
MLPVITVVLGTRPEAIKLAPVINKLKDKENICLRVVLTGQHKEMASDVIKLFNIIEDNNLEIMRDKQSLSYILRETLNGLKIEFKKYKPHLVIVQGDTSTAFAAALSAFYEGIPVAHVEAGLRTNNLHEPFPEEANRRLISQITSLHFAPTKLSEINLLKSGVSGEIFVTGNTVIDSLLFIANKNINHDHSHLYHENEDFILATVHRRENWGESLVEICEGFKLILHKYKKFKFIIPMHPNKIVRDELINILGSHPRIKLIDPLPYDELITLIKRTKLVLTDSGGLQEEVPALGKPVLVLRNMTERTEALESGASKLVGKNRKGIFEGVDNILSNSSEYQKMSNAINPYGNGNASEIIALECEKLIQR